jgi:multiple sugar transport system permease protein
MVVLFSRLFALRRKGHIAWKEAKAGFLFASPWLIGFFLFTFGPVIASIVFSFTEYDVLHSPTFVGVQNYATLVSGDPLYWKSLYNTAFLALFGVPLSIIVGLGLAIMLNREIRSIAAYRTLYYLPSIIPVVATAVLWQWLLNPQLGLVNKLLESVGLQGPNWLGDPSYTKISLILMLVWTSGSGMVIWLAGLKSIPRELYEVAQIDGAGILRRFWSITIPILTPYIFFNVVMGVISYFQIFAQAYVLIPPFTPVGGPEDSLLVYVLYLFNNGFQYFKMGYASAMAWILFTIIMTLTLINFKLAPRWVHYTGADK